MYNLTAGLTAARQKFHTSRTMFGLPFFFWLNDRLLADNPWIQLQYPKIYSLYRVSQKKWYIKFFFSSKTHRHGIGRNYMDKMPTWLRCWLKKVTIHSEFREKKYSLPGSEKSHCPVGTIFYPKHFGAKWLLAIW